MPLYIGIIETDGVNRLYQSSVPYADDKFETESIMADCSDRGKRDYCTAKTDLRIMENKLRNAGIPGNLILSED